MWDKSRWRGIFGSGVPLFLEYATWAQGFQSRHTNDIAFTLLIILSLIWATLSSSHRNSQTMGRINNIHSKERTSVKGFLEANFFKRRSWHKSAKFPNSFSFLFLRFVITLTWFFLLTLHRTNTTSDENSLWIKQH